MVFAVSEEARKRWTHRGGVSFIREDVKQERIVILHRLVEVATEWRN